jgi:predicted transcriptional regulator with HTH domain
MEMEKLNKLSELHKRLLERYKFYKFTYLDETSTDLKSDFNDLEDEISGLQAEWVIAMCEVKRIINWEDENDEVEK